MTDICITNACISSGYISLDISVAFNKMYKKRCFWSFLKIELTNSLNYLRGQRVGSQLVPWKYSHVWFLSWDQLYLCMLIIIPYYNTSILGVTRCSQCKQDRPQELSLPHSYAKSGDSFGVVLFFFLSVRTIATGHILRHGGFQSLVFG